MKTTKQFVKKIPIIGNLLVPFYKKFWSPKKFSVAYWIEKLTKNRNLKIVQVGSNDGKTTDPLFTSINKNLSWEVLFVEPVSYLFEKLKTNYSEEPRFKFENTLINDGSPQTFYWVREEAIERFPNLPTCIIS